MANKKVAKTEFAQGDWVEVTKNLSYNGTKKGTLAVVAQTKKRDWQGNDNVRIVYMKKDGFDASDRARIVDGKAEGITKIKAPSHIVAWSTPYSDPFCYFKNATDAKAFVAELKKRRGFKKAIETGVYKRTK